MSKSSSVLAKSPQALTKKKVSKTSVKSRVKTSTKAKPKVATKTLKKTEVKTPKKASPKKAVKTKVKTAKTKSNKKTKVTKAVTEKSVIAKPKSEAIVIPRILGTNQSILKRNPLGHLLIEKILREEGFKGGVTTDKKILDRYSTDESVFMVKPQVVVQPKDRHDVEIITKIIARETKRFDSLSLTPRANGNGFDGGALSDSVVVDMATHLTKIGEVTTRKGEVIFSAEAGASWRDIEVKLKAHKAFLPACAAMQNISTIGGIIGCNSKGSDSSNYGLCSDYIQSIDVVLADGYTYTIKPLTYKDFKALKKEKHELSRILQAVFSLLKKHEANIKNNTANSKETENQSSFSVSKILPQGTEAFMKGEGVFDLVSYIAGSRGAVGIITNLKIKALPVKKDTTVLSVPIFQLEDMSNVITKVNKYNPISFEIFDNKTFDRALKNPNFFKRRLEGLSYYRSMLSLYTAYHVRFGKRTPEFTLVAVFDKDTLKEHSGYEIVTSINTAKTRSRIVTNSAEAEMLSQLNNTYYTLSKLESDIVRPATFLKSISVPADKLAKFLNDVQKMFKDLNVQYTVHGQGHNSLFNFYPQLNFTEKTAPLLVEKLSEKFYDLVDKHEGEIYETESPLVSVGLTKNSNTENSLKPMLDLYTQIENIFDPNDIFNPGMKTTPRFDIKGRLRNIN